MFSRRTAWLLALTLLLTAGVGGTLHRQHVRCASLVRPGARRAPIVGASNGSTLFGCRDIPNFATPTEKATELFAFLAVLALFRSLWIDRHVRRQRGFE